MQDRCAIPVKKKKPGGVWGGGLKSNCSWVYVRPFSFEKKGRLSHFLVHPCNILTSSSIRKFIKLLSEIDSETPVFNQLHVRVVETLQTHSVLSQW